MSESEYWQRDYSKSSTWTRKEAIEIFVPVDPTTNEVDLDSSKLYRDGCKDSDLCDPWVWMKATLTIEDTTEAEVAELVTQAGGIARGLAYERDQLRDALQRIAALYDDSRPTILLASAMYDAKCIAITALQKQ